MGKKTIENPISKDTKTILIVDDHAVVRQSLLRCLKQVRPIYKFLEAQNGEDAITEVSKNKVDLILLDLQMPGKNGIETLTEIKKNQPTIKAIMLTMYNEPSIVLYALQHGADGFLTKDINFDIVLSTIEKVLSGGYSLDGIAGEVIKEFAKRPDDFPNLNLSRREIQVMELIGLGMTNKEIAKELDLEVFTVESYRKTLMKKTKCTNTAQLVSFAIKVGGTLTLKSNMK
ncbi:MAG: response regulator transcription factor [Bacteroidetes bacterium]|nr:response regulator transcription factor [Bacteroidota bacterium]